MYVSMIMMFPGRSAEADRRFREEVGGPAEGEGEGPAQDLIEKSCRRKAREK